MLSFDNQLAGARSSFRSLVESLPLAACICDWTTLAISHANAESARLFGYEREEFLRLTLRDIGPVGVSQGSFDLLIQQASADDATNGPTLVRGCRRRDGTTADLEVWLRSLVLEGRRVLLVLAHDIAERLRAHCMPCETQRRFQALFDHALDAFLLLDDRGHCLDANPSAASLLGYAREELRGVCLSDTMGRSSAAVADGVWAQLLGDGRLHGEMELARRDGLKVRAEYVAIANIEPFVHLLMLRDLTPREQAEMAVSNLSARLLKLQDDERRRIARELHDHTSQHFAALSLDLALLDGPDARLDPRARDALRRCQVQIEKCRVGTRTLTYLLHPPELDECGLVPALRQYVPGIAERSRIAMTFEVSPGFPRLDPELELVLFRIVQECLSNVIRHSHSPTAVVQLGLTTNQVTLKVTDQGCGMARRAAESPDGIAGLGVGIAGMRERVRQLSGRLEFQSSTRGTTVVATIPSGAANGRPPCES